MREIRLSGSEGGVAFGLSLPLLDDWAFSPKTGTTALHFQMHPNDVFRYPWDFNLVISSTGFVEEPRASVLPRSQWNGGSPDQSSLLLNFDC